MTMANARGTNVKVYRATDAPERALADEAVAVLGYGNLGRSAALNLRDSGVKVRVGNREDEYAARARAEGFEVVPLATAASDDVVFVLLPDEVIPEIFAQEIAPAKSDPVSLDTDLTNHQGDQGGRDGEEGAEADGSAGGGAGGQRGRGTP